MRHLRDFWNKAYADNLTGLAGMVAYNLLLSVFPLALIALFVAGTLIRSEELQASVVTDLRQVFPGATERTLDDALGRVRENATTAGVVALVASIWIGSSFWGALDTAFCRIYGVECRPWVRQKLFGLKMLGVVLLFFAASVSVPALQSLIAEGAGEVPFGLADVPALVYVLGLAAGLVMLFGVLCLIYRAVPNCAVPWNAIWPGAFAATVLMGIVDYAFPLYLGSVTTLAELGPSLVFTMIALLWFYALAMILLAGAEINELRRSVAPSQPASEASPSAA